MAHDTSGPPSTKIMNPTSILRAAAPFATTALFAISAFAQGPLTIGNLVVVRVGDGAAALSNASTATFLEEYTPAGTLVQTIPMPIAASGLNQPLTNSGTATSEGFLSVSVNGQYLLLGGYGVAPGLASVATSANPTVARVVGRVDLAGQVDTSTAIGDSFSGRNIRSVASDDGTRFWVTGSSDGIRLVTGLGATTTLAVSLTPLNNRVVDIYNGQLFGTSASTTFHGLSTVGTGLPTTTGNICTLLPGQSSTAGPSAYDFFFASPSVVYIADDRTTGVGGIQRWDLIAGTWTLQYTLALSPTSGCRGVTGFVQNGTTTLWATANSNTGATQLVTVVDTGAASVVTSLVTPAANTAFRGVRRIGKPSTLVRIPATCGAADITAAGNGEIGTNVTTTILNPLGIPFVGYGTLPLGAPFCGCTLVHEFAALLGGPQHTFPLPNNPTLIGIVVLIQGLDFLAPGGCPNPPLTLTDGYQFTIQ